MANSPNIPHRLILDEQEVGEKIYREQVDMLFHQFQLVFIAVALIAPLFIVYLHDETNTTTVITWLICFWGLILLRHYHCSRFLNGQPNTDDYPRWEKQFITGVAMSGVLWGSVAVLFFPEHDETRQVFLFFVLAGLTVGAISTLSSRPVALYLFIIPLITPYVIKLVNTSMHANLVMPALLVLYAIMMILISSRISNIINDSLRTRFEREQVMKQYTQLQELNEKTFTHLQNELEQKKIREEALQEQETFLQSIFVTANDGIITADHRGIIKSINHAIERDFGYSVKELIGRSINIIMSENMGNRHDNYITEYLNSNGPSMVGRMIEVEGRAKDGRLFPLEITVSEARINDRIFFTGIIRDISQRKNDQARLQSTMRELQAAKQQLEYANSQLQNSNDELLEQSLHDALTGLPNRRYLIKTMRHEWFRCQRNQNPLSVILLDIDFFKRFNDRYGHQAGDEILILICQELEKQLSRSSDFIARYGGEEFLVVLPETDQEGAYHMAEKMRNAVIDLAIEHNQSTVSEHVTISSGIATMVPVQDWNCEMLISAADRALYNAKEGGRNSIRIANLSTETREAGNT